MENEITSGVGFVPAPQFVNVVACASCCTTAPGLLLTVDDLTVENANTFFLRQGLESSQMSLSYVAANTVFPTLTGPDLAFDDGTVPPETLSCRIYTFFASINPKDAAVTLSVGYGEDFTKHRPAYANDAFIGDGTLAIIGYLYVKNESSAVFIPGTTALNASGITAQLTDQYGFPVIICG